jgi:hypothetical protein
MQNTYGLAIIGFTVLVRGRRPHDACPYAGASHHRYAI